MDLVNYFIRILIAWDQCWQSLLRFGKTGICISTRAYTAYVHGHRWGIFFNWWLGKLQKDHCWQSLLGDMNRAKEVIVDLSQYMPPEQRASFMVALNISVLNQRTLPQPDGSAENTKPKQDV